MMGRILSAAAAAMLLSACVNEAADLGHVPAAGLVTVSRQVVLGPRPSRAPSAALGRSVASVAEGDLGAVRARIVAAPPRRAEEVRRTLVRLGVDPSRITLTAALAGPSAVILTRSAFAPPDCRAAVGPAEEGDPLPSLMSLAHCHQRNDLAAMMADPADLVAPPSLAHADGAYLTDGLQSWRAERQAPYSAQGTTGTGEPVSSAPPSSAPNAVAGNVVTPTVAPAATPR